jgi:hypothetical protein
MILCNAPIKRQMLGMVSGLASMARARLWTSGPAPQARLGQRDPRCAEECMLVTLSSSGWRQTSRTWRRHSGNSSKKSTPWWASDTSPGIGTWPAADQPHIRDGLVRGTTRARRDHRRVGAGEASDAVGADGVDGLWQSYRRQGGGQPQCQHQRARPRGAQQQEIWVRTPA